MRRANACAMAALGLAICLAPGCGRNGPETIPVSGSVTLDGQPLSQAAVMFSGPEGKQPATAQTDGKGAFTIQAAPGSNAIAVAKTAGGAAAPGDGLMPVGGTPPPKALVPAKYSDFRTSELKADVIQGMTPITLELKSK